jgi:hypothetical protein
MPFGVGGFNPPSKKSFHAKSFGNFDDETQFRRVEDYAREVDKYKFTPLNTELKSRIRFYDHDSLWTRWRRGYELYTVTQSILGSFATERQKRGDFRLYCAFQQYPGVFISGRIFRFPTTDKETGEQIVGMRDANAFNFYDYGLPILATRYLGEPVTANYAQTGTTITITKSDHGLLLGESVYLSVLSGAALDETLSVVSVTQNTFTVTASSSISTSGVLIYYLSTNFADERWTTTRVKLQTIPLSANFLVGERLVDRVVEKDPGVSATYTRVASTVTVSCSAAHGLSTGNKVFVSVSSGTVNSGRYTITVINSTDFSFTTIDSGATSGNLTVNRLILGFRYDEYVGYTVSGVDATTNEVIFQRDDSYGTITVDEKAIVQVPAQRGFAVGRYLTTELRWQCSCQDFLRRDGYDLYSQLQSRRFPVTNISSTKPGQVQNDDNSISEERDIPGSFADLGYVTINNFYQLPDYKDTKEFSYPNLYYYQLRWCKHIYAALFSVLHDEGNEAINLAARYEQSGPNITVTSPDHGLLVNTRIQLDFTSGNAISGQYTINSVPDKDTFVVVYPFSSVSNGYVTVQNLREHDFVESWILEPNDKPVGDALDVFYKSFDKEREKLQEAAERMAVMNKKGMNWVGSSLITGDRNQPQEIADYSTQLVTMFLTDNLRRGSDGSLNRDGVPVNTTNRLLTLMSKLFNLEPTLIQDTKIGLLDKPLLNYVSDFEFGLIVGGEFINGTPLEAASTLSTIDCDTYSPLTAQDTVVDSGSFINT